MADQAGGVPGVGNEAPATPTGTQPVASTPPATTAPAVDVDAIVNAAVDRIMPRLQTVIESSGASTAQELRALQERQLQQEGRWQELAELRRADNERLQTQINQGTFGTRVASELSRQLGVSVEVANRVAANIPFEAGDPGAVATRYITTNRGLIDLVVAGAAATAPTPATSTPPVAATPPTPAHERIFPAPPGGNPAANPGRVEPSIPDARTMDDATYAAHKGGIVGPPLANRIGGRRLRSVA